MAAPTDIHVRIVLLNDRHNRRDFDCGTPVLNRYLATQAGQDVRKRVSSVYVLEGDAPEVIAGYYTLIAAAVDPSALPHEIVKKMPRYPTLPTTLLGRLAVDHRYQKRGYGKILLLDALEQALHLSKKIGSMAVVVDAKDERAAAFYHRFRFTPFHEQPQRLFIPMTTLAELFGSSA
jgi:GNAT superfamily N-acetyltransferase